MKNIYKMIYTIDNTAEEKADLIDVDFVIEQKSYDEVKILLNKIEFQPDEKIVEKIIEFARKG